MLFETSNKRQASTVSKPVVKPVQQSHVTQPQDSHTLIRNPTVSNARTVRPQTTPNAHTTQVSRPPIAGKNNLVQKSGRSPVSANAKLIQTQKVYSGTSAINSPKKQVVGWPSYQQASKKLQALGVPRPGTLPLTKLKHPLAISQKPVQGRAYYQAPKKMQSAVPSIPIRRGTYRPTTTMLQRGIKKGSNHLQWVKRPKYTGNINMVQQKRAYRVPAASRMIRRPATGRQYYYPETRRYITYYRGGVEGQPIYTSASAAPQIQTTIPREPSNQGYRAPTSTSQPCDCSQCRSQGASIETGGPYKSTNVAPQRVCPSCGSRTKGCITLKEFTINSARLNPYHKQQIRQLATTILQQNSNAVVVTGFTNSSRQENIVENLGERRALAVIIELKRQLARLKPNAYKHIFWKTASKAVTQSGVAASASNNRRVHICIRQLR